MCLGVTDATGRLCRVLRVADLATRRCRADAVGPGLVLGYRNLADGQIDEAVALLATAVADSRRML